MQQGKTGLLWFTSKWESPWRQLTAVNNFNWDFHYLFNDFLQGSLKIPPGKWSSCSCGTMRPHTFIPGVPPASDPLTWICGLVFSNVSELSFRTTLARPKPLRDLHFKSILPLISCWRRDHLRPCCQWDLGMCVGSIPLFCSGDEQQGDGSGDPLVLTWALVMISPGGESSSVNYPTFWLSISLDTTSFRFFLCVTGIFSSLPPHPPPHPLFH